MLVSHRFFCHCSRRILIHIFALLSNPAVQCDGRIATSCRAHFNVQPFTSFGKHKNTHIWGPITNSNPITAPWHHRQLFPLCIYVRLMAMLMLVHSVKRAVGKPYVSIEVHILCIQNTSHDDAFKCMQRLSLLPWVFPNGKCLPSLTL